MEKTPLGNMMEKTMSQIKEMVDANTVVGEPITTLDGVTLVPITKVSFGFGTGGAEFPTEGKGDGYGGGNGAGVSISPVGFIVIKDGNVRMLNVAPPANTAVDRIVELVPDIMDRAQEFIDKRKEDY